MDKKAFLKEIDNDLEKMRQEHGQFFTQKNVVILLALLAKYKKEQSGTNVINLINKLDLLIKDLRHYGYNDMFGAKDPFMYIVRFIENKWEPDIVKVESWGQFWTDYMGGKNGQ